MAERVFKSKTSMPDESTLKAKTQHQTVTNRCEKAENPKSVEENSVTLGKVCDLKERMEKLSLKQKTKKAGNQSAQRPILDDTSEAVLSRKLPSLNNSKVEGVALKSRSDFSKVPILPDIITHPLQSTSRDLGLSLRDEGSSNMGESIRPKTCPATLRESQFYDLYEDEDFQNPLQITQPQFRSCVSACATDDEWRGGKAFLQSLQSLSVLPPIDHGPGIADDRRKVADDRRTVFEANSISSIEQINLHHGRRNPIKFNSAMRVETPSDLSPDPPKTNFPVDSQDLRSVTTNHIAQWAESPATARLNLRGASGMGGPSISGLPHGWDSLDSKRPLQARLQTWAETPYWTLSDETKDYSKNNLSEPPETVRKDSEKKSRLRCAQCKKRLSLANIFECRCGLTFCSYHRYAEAHRCTYDFKKESRKLLELANPAVITPKLPKI